MTLLQTSKSINELRYSVIREMGGMAAHMDNVINLSIGAPDFLTPQEITEKAFADARKGHTHYTPSQGDPELVDKIVSSLSLETGTIIEPSSILVTHGGMGALTACLRTLIEPGDHVLLVEPYFPDYIAHITFAGGIATKTVTHAENGYIPQPAELEKAITPKTRLLILNSPNNPTGAVIPGDTLDAIARIAIKHNLFVVSDEVYDRIIFDVPFESISSRPGMYQRTVVIKSFSKSHAMTGWRIGYCFGPKAIIEQVLKVVNYSTACASSISQRGALAALNIDQEIVESMRKRFKVRVELVWSRLNRIKGVRATKPGGSFYLFVDISAITTKSRDFAIRLLNEQKVVVVPGYAFGESGEGCIRIACTRSRKQLNKAMDRLETFINSTRES